MLFLNFLILSNWSLMTAYAVRTQSQYIEKEMTNALASKQNAAKIYCEAFTGKAFKGGMVYPSEAEVALMPLSQLVSLRPRKIKPAEQEHYAHLFAVHPDVSKLKCEDYTSERFIHEWANLWTRELNDPHGKKLHQSIMDHLISDPSVDDDTVSKIVRRRQRIVDAIAQRRKRERRRDSNDAHQRAKYVDELVRVRNYHRQRAKLPGDQFIHQSADKFRLLLEDNKIPLHLPMKELEEKTRFLRKAIDGAQHTTISLRHYLHKNYGTRESASDIRKVMQSRRDFNYRMTSKKFNDKTQGKKRAIRLMRKQVKKSADNYEDLVMGMSDKSNSASDSSSNLHFRDLVRRSIWWTL